MDTCLVCRPSTVGQPCQSESFRQVQNEGLSINEITGHLLGGEGTKIGEKMMMHSKVEKILERRVN